MRVYWNWNSSPFQTMHSGRLICTEDETCNNSPQYLINTHKLCAYFPQHKFANRTGKSYLLFTPCKPFFLHHIHSFVVYMVWVKRSCSNSFCYTMIWLWAIALKTDQRQPKVQFASWEIKESCFSVFLKCNQNIFVANCNRYSALLWRKTSSSRSGY